MAAETSLFFSYPETGAEGVYSEIQLLDRLLASRTSGCEYHYRGRRHMRTRREYLQKLLYS